MIKFLNEILWYLKFGEKIHMDCDPGTDDAVAMLYIFGSRSPKKIEIADISVVGGNAEVEKCALNALKIIEASTRQSKTPAQRVFVGAAQPLKRLGKPLPEVFGECGMMGAEYLLQPAYGHQTDKTAIDYLTTLTYPLADPTSLEKTLPTTFLATGPLTNLALAIEREPRLKTWINTLVIMGGCAFPEPLRGNLGNYKAPGTNGWAEYNFAVDPEAAKQVFQAKIRNVAMVGVDITRSVLFNHEVEKGLRKNGNFCSKLAADILSTIGEEDLEDYASVKAFPSDPVRAMHDVIAAAYLCDPDMFETEVLPIRIVVDEVGGIPGQTIIDDINPDHIVTVVRDLDRDRFKKTLIQNLARLP